MKGERDGERGRRGEKGRERERERERIHVGNLTEKGAHKRRERPKQHRQVTNNSQLSSIHTVSLWNEE